jgi:hypothetical protein
VYNKKSRKTKESLAVKNAGRRNEKKLYTVQKPRLPAKIISKTIFFLFSENLPKATGISKRKKKPAALLKNPLTVRSRKKAREKSKACLLFRRKRARGMARGIILGATLNIWEK